MKNLLVSALMLSTMALSAAAAGTYDYCSAGSRILSNRNVAMEDDLTSYRGVNCETDPKVIITFDATKAPNGFGITGTFSDGTIGAGGAINIKGPGQSSVENTAPILIRIERNIFATDAIMYITGSFPTSSLISISNNEFNVGNRHDLLVGINTNFISAITFGDYETEQLLYTNAQVTVFSNAIQVEDRSGDAQPFEVYGVYASSHIYMSNEAGFIIQRNNITGGSQVKAVGVYCPRYCFMMGNNTLAQITANRVELTNGVMAHTPGISVAGEFLTTADFSQNTARLTPVHSLTYALILGPMNITSYSSVEVADNVILNVNNGDSTAALSTRIFVNGPIQTRDHAGVYIWFNTMDTQGGSPQMAFGAPITIQQQSRVWFVGNQMERKEGLILALAPIYMGGLSLENEGNFVLSQNVFGSGNMNSKPLFLTLANNAPMYKSENATFDICRNKWFGEEFATTSMLTSSLSPAVRPMITDLSQCPAEITTTTSTAPPTTTTTTTTTGTTVPEDNANAAPAVSSVVAAVAVVAAALVLIA